MRQAHSKSGVHHKIGPAPNKPILLLAVLEMVEAGDLTTPDIPPDPLLTDTFSQIWESLPFPERKMNMALPYFHLHRDGIIEVHDEHGPIQWTPGLQFKSWAQVKERITMRSSTPRSGQRSRTPH